MMLSDHPHTGEENSSVASSVSAMNGPSPRGWGERAKSAQPRHKPRTIPTRVGRTIAIYASCIIQTDHPHAGGENSLRPSLSPASPGPSPRGWGEPYTPIFNHSPHRTIPTRVGRTKKDTKCDKQSSDHPHAGGENHSTAVGISVVVGPSPRGWGERGAEVNDAFVHRTIPTRVGRTPAPKGPKVMLADHPHAGGEN